MSDEGLERLTKRVGLDCLWEENPGTRVFVIAGDTVALEIGMKDHVVQSVSLQFPVSGPSVTKYTSKAEAIILDDLKLAPNQIPWKKSLKKFAANLKRLAILDKLSVLDKDDSKPHIVTHDAVAGLYESLDKLHDWDIKKIREDSELSQKSDDHIRILAMCERNGQPVMHERGHVGMCLDYWREQRLFSPRSEESREKYKLGKTWGMLIGCAERNALVYSAPVRVSNQWIADEIELPAADGLQGPILKWQEPPESLLPGTAGVQPDDPLALSGPKLADVMFMATLDPPVTLPSSVWEEMHHLTGAPPPHLNPAFMHTFDYLIFPPEGEYSAAEPRMITTVRIVKAFTKDRRPAPKLHENRLFIHKPVYGQTLTELPFSHPSQLVNMLPTLRQYAFLWNLLSKAFGKVELKEEEETSETDSKPVAKVTAKSDEFQTWLSNKADKKTGIDHPMNGVYPLTGERPVKVDVTLNAHPQPNPKLQIMFPFRGRPAQITVDIERNGVVQVESTNVVDDEGRVLDGNGRPVEGAEPNLSWKKERLGRKLMFFEDIGLWCEYIRIYLGE